MFIADLEEELQNILTTVSIESENKRLQLNAKKAEYMVISKQSDIPIRNILCKGERIKQVGAFKYLGFTITPGTRWDTKKEENSFVKRHIHHNEFHLYLQKYQT